jgi:hypothetical protein
MVKSPLYVQFTFHPMEYPEKIKSNIRQEISDHKKTEAGPGNQTQDSRETDPCLKFKGYTIMSNLSFYRYNHFEVPWHMIIFFAITKN